MKYDRIGGTFLLLLGLTVFLTCLTYPIGSLSSPGAGLFPLLGSVILMILAVIMIVQTFLKKDLAESSPDRFFSSKEAPQRILTCFIALLAFRYLLPVIGFSPTTFVFILIASRFLGNYNWKVSLFFSLITSISVYYFFQVLLHVPMPTPMIGF
jgi:putative tricarboxylic transport membrane protein